MTHNVSSEVNKPERFLSWRWEDEDEACPLQYLPDTRTPNAGLFVLGKEDHTLGNLIRLQLLRDNTVRFAGYKVPHPLSNDVQVKVQTSSSKTSPMRVFEAALEDLSSETELMEREFRDAMLEFERREFRD